MYFMLLRHIGVYMRRSNVIDVVAIIRRHVGGIPNVNQQLKWRKLENSSAKVFLATHNSC